MRSRAFVIALVLGMAAVGQAWAGARKEKGDAKEASGTFVSATVDGATVKWKLAVDMEGEKVYEMPAQVAVLYVERNGQKVAHLIHTPGKRAQEAKGNRLIAQGTVVKAEVQGNKVALTLKAGEGENAGEQQFTLGSRLTVSYLDGTPLVAVAFRVGKAKADKAERKPGKGDKGGGNEPPENF